jgi:hypothetical protein
VSKKSGRLRRSLDNATLKLMEGRYPFIKLVRQTRKTINSFGHRSLDFDGKARRTYFSTWPFRSISARNQPRAFLFCGPKWLRFLIVPESPDHVTVYVDIKAEEFGAAAALSGDAVMRKVYEDGDPHEEFARLAGAIPSGATEKDIEEIRGVYKAANLGSLYGMTGFGLADRLGVTRSEAEGLLRQHKTIFEQYWSWSNRAVRIATRKGRITTKLGWACEVPAGSNHRTWANWPIQSTCFDLMKMISIYLDSRPAKYQIDCNNTQCFFDELSQGSGRGSQGRRRSGDQPRIRAGFRRLLFQV